MRKKSLSGQPQDIHVVDMAKDRDDNEYAKDGPRDYKSLHRLHRKVNKPTSARVLLQTKPTFSYAQGDQPCLSFLGNTSKVPHNADHTSSDYGDDWMDDLPSTSALLDHDTGVQKELISTYATSPVNASLEEELEPTQVVIAEADLPFEDGLSDLEAAMVGTNAPRSLTNQGPLRSGKAVELESEDDSWTFDKIDKENGRRSQVLFSSAAPNKDASTPVPRKEGRLFLSTDSPEKPRSASKRQHSNSDQDLPSSDPVQEPAQKRRAVSGVKEDARGPIGRANSPHEPDDSTQTLGASTFGANQTPTLERLPNGGRPLPAWVNEFDPTFLEYFLKEYGHLVEFV